MAWETGLLAGLLLLAAGLAFALLQKRGFAFPGCPIKEITGLFCVACGGSRAFLCLLQGRILTSLWYHPLVLYTILAYGFYMGSLTWNMIMGKWKRLPVLYHRAEVFAGTGLLLLNALVHNLWGM